MNVKHLLTNSQSLAFNVDTKSLVDYGEDKYIYIDIFFKLHEMNTKEC